MIEVTLYDGIQNPVRSLFVAYRCAYSSLTPQQILRQIEREKITYEQMEAFCAEKLQTGHTSPLEAVVFQFAISGVTRAFSHQFVRSRIGVSPEQQSQRYVTLKDGKFNYTMPETIKADVTLANDFEYHMRHTRELYAKMVERGIPAEDARSILPNATTTNLVVTINLTALVHMADLRLCTRAQAEYRKVVSLMRRELMLKFPLFGRMLGIKCQLHRSGICDESLKDYLACPLSRSKNSPLHKSQLLQLRVPV